MRLRKVDKADYNRLISRSPPPYLQVLLEACQQDQLSYEISVANPVNEKDFHLGRIAKARSRAFRAVLTAFWKICSAAFS